MTEDERFIEIEHKLDKADEDLTQTVHDVVELKKQVAELKDALAKQGEFLTQVLSDHAELIGHALTACIDMNVIQVKPDKNEAYHQFTQLFRKYSPRFNPSPYTRLIRQ
jgi:transcriptional accessory protein Tex/SPT6